MKSIKLTAFAKVNLSLNITGMSGAMHALDSVMMSVDVFDTVTVTERGDGKINVAMIGADIDPVRNTAYRAAVAAGAAIGVGWDIEVQKGIPVGAGLGGSSADGAATLRALELMYGDRLKNLRASALSVGSDVPFMLTGGLARVRGTGDDMFFIENKLRLFGLGLMSEQVSTAEAYARFDELYPSRALSPTDNDRLCELLLSGDSGASSLFGNALFCPAAALAPSVSRNYDTLKDLGAAACMTGSGGMVVGWFADIGAFASAAQALKGRAGVRAFAPAPTGILHEWISRE